MKGGNRKFLHKISQKKIDPPAVTGAVSVTTLIEEAFLSYNAGRLREACRLFTSKMLGEKVTVGLSRSGALTPAGLGISCSGMARWCQAGFIRLDRQHGREPLSRHALRPGHGHASGRPGLDDSTPEKMKSTPRIYDITSSITRICSAPIVSIANSARGAGTEEDHGDCGVSLLGWQVPGRPGS